MRLRGLPTRTHHLELLKTLFDCEFFCFGFLPFLGLSLKRYWL